MPFYAGFALSLGLIIAIGAQNAFVLRQGVANRHVLAVCLCCALSDVILIAAGVAGIGTLARAHPGWITALRYAGAAFLAAYAVASLCRALRGGTALTPEPDRASSLKRTLAVCLALTWLNPHVYIDTLVLLGTVAATYGDQRSGPVAPFHTAPARSVPRSCSSSPSASARAVYAGCSRARSPGASWTAVSPL